MENSIAKVIEVEEKGYLYIFDNLGFAKIIDIRSEYYIRDMGMLCNSRPKKIFMFEEKTMIIIDNENIIKYFDIDIFEVTRELHDFCSYNKTKI